MGRREWPRPMVQVVPWLLEVRPQPDPHSRCLREAPAVLQCPDNITTWEITLLAYVSLEPEGGRSHPSHRRRRSCQPLALRHEAHWRADRPPPPPVFVPLSEVEAEGGGEVSVAFPGPSNDRGSLTTMLTRDGFRLGMWSRRNLTSADPRIARPSAPGECGHLQSREYIATDLGSDLEFVNQHFGEALASGSSLTKNSAKLASIAVQVQPLLAAFSAPSWETVLESRFHPLFDEFSTAGAKAGCLGDAVALAASEPWIEGISSGKFFIKVCKEFVRSKFKASKLREMKLHAKIFDAFLQARGIHAHYTPPPRPAAVFNGCPRCLALALHVACNGKARARRGVGDGGLRHRAADLHRGCPDDVGVLVAGSAKTTMEALRSFSVVLKAAGPECKCPASLARKRLDCLGAGRLTLLREKMYGCTFGKTIIFNIIALIQASSKDEVAATKLDRAVEIVRDSRLPALTPAQASGADGRLCQCNALVDMSFVESLEEGLCLVAEALRLFSAPAAENASRSFHIFPRELVSPVSFYDECFCVYLEALLPATSIGRLIRPQESDTSNDGPEVGFLDMGQTLASRIVDEEPMAKFAGQISNFALGLPSYLSPPEGFCKPSGTLRRTFRRTSPCASPSPRR